MEENKVFKKLKDKKGFTLVELIVVLVILAILAALLVPALTGYIDKARNKQVIAETRSAVMAAQTLVDEAYSKTTQAVTATTSGTTATTEVQVGSEKVTNEAVAKLAELTTANIQRIEISAEGKVTKLIYSNGKTCTYSTTAISGAVETDGNYYVTNAAASAGGNAGDNSQGG
ncbi:prepilin-type N-terminal cleavage/methylation domain-containing protein [uncultured Gemmiger sp.]|uniref:type II secretion system protein n=1 Tax=uncultured Gemmiger sp. TaxID=1623490 RepID=UPI0025FD3A47|nr:prepilin-type N-terminal cleavage/methylation domain-containing protein [uncultured Gemmiger sp.]